MSGLRCHRRLKSGYRQRIHAVQADTAALAYPAGRLKTAGENGDRPAPRPRATGTAEGGEACSRRVRLRWLSKLAAPIVAVR